VHLALYEELAISQEKLQNYEAQQGLDTFFQAIKETKHSERGQKLFSDLNEINQPDACREEKIEEKEEEKIEEKSEE
jgi:hypothetical protein